MVHFMSRIRPAFIQRAPLRQRRQERVLSARLLSPTHCRTYSQLCRQSTKVTMTPASAPALRLLPLLLILLLPLIRAQIPHWGPCPDPPIQAGFKIRQFMGRWFEIAKLPAQFEMGRCIETNFTLLGDGSLRLVSSEIEKKEFKYMEGTGVIIDPNNPGKLGITFAYVLPYSPYSIMATDYVGWALVYSCTDVIKLFHIDFAWVLSRKRTLPATDIDKAKQFFIDNNIDVAKMTLTKQTGCNGHL